ncbi:GNAT family N-acetyltransferase [Dactylosporangium siamense]|uniref:ElaA protein n=1 Tax=Dactylosporangium siamense TaxID=685454 RepID=A0A919PIQ4_9ACTN|nr:GNAT family N-acetyltransferase [Dactylosporangium siamense]GIG44177.1 ElaA protein [Dactylosporangium siamense]
MILHSAPFAALDVFTLYALLRLRNDVFVVEQDCVYPDLDGRDTDPDTVHVWLTSPAGNVTAYLRVLSEPDGTARIGRVVTEPAHRGQGLAGRLLAEAVSVVGPRAAVLDAQTTAIRVYERFGFTVSGPAFLDDGIEHVPMWRPAP